MLREAPKKRAIRVAITAGDPAGIGPEVALKAINRLDPGCIPVLICRRSQLEFKHLPGHAEYVSIDPINFSNVMQPGYRYIDNVIFDGPIAAPGFGNPDTGRESLLYIDRALDLWRSGAVDAIVTAPVSKALIEKSGTHFTGHTEYLAEAVGGAVPHMLMYSESYSVVLVTTHLSLAGAAASIDENSIVSAAKAGYQAVSSIKGINAKIAVAGLDPHCGDEGAIGDFDMKVTSRAVNALRDDGIAVDGPVPADSLFIPDRWELYDLAVAMYHDQGLIPFKMLSFDNGVNITLGLPLVRTSPDHGTAFDIAGRGIARYESMKAAIELAVRLAENNKANESD